MTQHVSSFNAKTHLSNLLNQVAEGEEFIITRRNNPIARLTPIKDPMCDKNIVSLIKEIKLARKSHSLNLEGGINKLKAEGRK